MANTATVKSTTKPAKGIKSVETRINEYFMVTGHKRKLTEIISGATTLTEACRLLGEATEGAVTCSEAKMKSMVQVLSRSGNIKSDHALYIGQGKGKGRAPLSEEEKAERMEARKKALAEEKAFLKTATPEQQIAHLVQKQQGKLAKAQAILDKAAEKVQAKADREAQKAQKAADKAAAKAQAKEDRAAARAKAKAEGKPLFHRTDSPEKAAAKAEASNLLDQAKEMKTKANALIAQAAAVLAPFKQKRTRKAVAEGTTVPKAKVKKVKAVAVTA